jgi:hypothetical protein
MLAYTDTEASITDIDFYCSDRLITDTLYIVYIILTFQSDNCQRQVGGFLRVLQFLPPIKLTTTI